MITVTKEFKQAFERVTDHYGVKGAELEFERARVRLSYPEAELCYLSIYESIKLELDQKDVSGLSDKVKSFIRNYIQSK